VLLAGVAASGCSARTGGGGDGGTDEFRLDVAPWPEDVSFASALYQNLGVPLVAGNRVERVDNGAVFDAIVEEIAGARASVHVLAYIWTKGQASDRVIDALAGRDRAVECRILVDAFGSTGFDDELRGPLEEVGCEVRVFRPLPGRETVARNHRKLVVADGQVAITGGFGIRDEWLGDARTEDEWRDTNVRFRGPAVAQAQQAFAENWLEAGGGFLPAHAFPRLAAAGEAGAAFVTSTASPVLTRAERMLHLLLAAGKRRIWISMAYFVAPDALLAVLQRKAEAGVDVRLLVPGVQSDSKTSFGSQQLDYGELIERGVRVWEFKPGMMHAKTMVIDDELAMVGSQNLDPLALHELDEGSLIVEDRAFNEGLAAAFVRDCERSEAVGRE
jgi:cardiolipin synthase